MNRIITFIRLWAWFSLREMKAHPWQTAAVLCGVALGASVYGSVRVAVMASVDSFSRSMDAIAGKADHSVITPGGRVQDALVPQLLKLPGIVTASPFSSTHVHSPGAPGGQVLLIGVDPILDRPLRSWMTTQNRTSPPSLPSSPSSAWLELIRRPYTCILPRDLADRLNVHEGGAIVLKNHLQSRTFHVVKTLQPEGPALANSGSVILTDISTFQEFMDSRGWVDRIDILLQTPVSRDETDALHRLLPPGTQLTKPGEEKESGRSLIEAYELNLSVMSFVSLFVGMFLVFSLVALHATSRRHEVAVLRSIGASSATVAGIFLCEGLFLGAAGWILAMPVSLFLVRKMVSHVSMAISHLFVKVQVSSLQPTPDEVLWTFLLTMGVSFLAASVPAWEAVKVPPGEALPRQIRNVQLGRGQTRPAVWGAALVVTAWALPQLTGGKSSSLPGYIATFLLFLGFSLTSPRLLRMCGELLPERLRSIGGEPAYLGAAYVKSSGNRSAISVGALITAMALFVALAIMVHSFRNTVELWVHQSIAGDVFIRPKMAEVNDYRDPLPSWIVEELTAREPNIELSPYRRIYLRMDKAPYQFEAVDFHKFLRHSSFLMIEGNMADIRPQLERGEGALISEVFSNRCGLEVGERFTAVIDGVNVSVPILGVFRDYRTRGGLVHFSLPRFEEMTGRKVWSGVRVFISPWVQDKAAAVPGLMDDLMKAHDDGPSVAFTPGDELRGDILKIFDETFAVTTVMLLIALVVAALSITTTLAVLVLERGREIHTLMAVGASRGQTRLMILWEALIMVSVGEMAGLACGLMLSRILVFHVNRRTFGWTFLYDVDWAGVLSALPLILCTAVLAALPAAQLVFKRSTARALRE